MNLVDLQPKGRIVFIGDTHGEYTTSQRIVVNHLKPNTRLVFLGDYVDRGPESRENADYLLELRKKHPRKVYLLQGNHEGYKTKGFLNANFWESLSKSEANYYHEEFSKLPSGLLLQGVVEYGCGRGSSLIIILPGS
ncbi:serine/threonine protein phosphatase [Candidatus Pacearchaeota archaeon]|nr:serine/threonine protein phosphatase [Candidatus Pacearchaeota archaeon]